MTAREPERGDGIHHEPQQHGAGRQEAEKPRIYLRTTWALNPGLPHTVDFPDLWR